MARLWQQIMKSEQGQALPIVLILLVVGGLMVVPSLDYASTSLNAGRIVKQNLRGVYAADAGVEHVLWQIKNGNGEPDEELPENVNELEVTMETEEEGEYVLYQGGFVETDKFYDWLAVAGEFGDWIEEENAYQYTITVTWQPPPPGTPDILLDDVGVRLPVGYSYQSGSAAIFSEDNLFDDDEPVDTLDGAGAHMLNWELQWPPPEPRPMVTEDNQTATQTFYVTGEGEQEGDYAWALSGMGSVDKVSEVAGTLYTITATATRPGDGEVMAKVRADVLLYEGTGEINIISWQTNPQEDDD